MLLLTYPHIYFKTTLTLLLPGRQTNDYSRGGVFRTRSYFQLIWTPFWTRGTIFEQLSA